MVLEKNIERIIIIYGITLISVLIFITGASGLEANNSCVDCHKKISPFTDAQARLDHIVINHTERNVSCSLDCHIDVARKTVINNYQQWSDSAHAKYFVTCDQCHGGNPGATTEKDAHSGMLNNTDNNSGIYFKNIPETCGKCHKDELDNFKNTMHYQRLNAEALAPSCATCHQPHTFNVPATSDIVKLCNICHNQKSLPNLATIPIDAQNALGKANELHDEIIRTQESINHEKFAGKDTSSAQNYLDKATSVMNNMASMWHKFDLQNFDQQIQYGMNSVENAQNRLANVNTSTNKKVIPDISISLVILIIFLIYTMNFVQTKRR